jgi:hypothetical protein
MQHVDRCACIDCKGNDKTSANRLTRTLGIASVEDEVGIEKGQALSGGEEQKGQDRSRQEY